MVNLYKTKKDGRAESTATTSAGNARKKESVMTNNTVETAIEIARSVAKDSTAKAETRKLGRNFQKRKRDQREGAAPKFLTAMIEAYGLHDDATPGAILAAANGAKPNAETPTETPTETPAETPKQRPHATISVSDVADALSQDQGSHLGDLCGWSINGSRPKNQVEDLAAKHGLDDELFFPKNTPNSCYRKAVSQVFKTGKQADRRWQAVLVEDSANKIVHSVVTTQVIEDDDDSVSSMDASFTTEMKIGFNKEAYKNGASAEGCLVTEDFSHPAAIRFKEVYLELAETYLAYDIRNSFQHAFRKWDACPVLPHGGLWYIPSIHASKVRAWNNFMIELGMTTVVIPTFDTAETIASLRESTQNSLDVQLAEIFRAIEYSAEQGMEKTRTSTMEARIQEFDELRNRAELYSNILGNTIDDLKSSIQTAADGVMRDLTARKDQEERDAKEAADQKANEKERKAAERKAAREAKAKAKAEKKGAENVAQAASA